MLNLPSGRLVAADPFVTLKRVNAYYAVPPGRSLVYVTRNETLQRAMYVSVLFSKTLEAFRAPLAPYHTDGAKYPTPGLGNPYGVTVDAGAVCLVDAEALRRGMPEDETTWYTEVYAPDGGGGWFSHLAAHAPLPCGMANVPLPLAADGANIFLCYSGWGDGYYPVTGGYDASGRLVAVHIDLLLFESITGKGRE